VLAGTLKHQLIFKKCLQNRSKGWHKIGCYVEKKQYLTAAKYACFGGLGQQWLENVEHYFQ